MADHRSAGQSGEQPSGTLIASLTIDSISIGIIDRELLIETTPTDPLGQCAESARDFPMILVAMVGRGK